MAPIRVGLMGLSTSNDMNASGSWGTNSHLPSFLTSPHYDLVAVCNSTTKSAQASIAHHKLPSTTKAYGDPKDLANDPNVDLVAISVNVEKHYMLAKPALLAGKDLFVEWPLGASTKEAEELTTLAKSKGVKTAVGLQARASPLVVKLKEIIDSGKIGKVLSSTALGSFGDLPSNVWMKGAEYYLALESGGNNYTIYFGHFLDTFTQVLGNFETLSSVVKNQYPTVILFDGTGNVADPAYSKTAPDHIFVQGSLASGAAASVNFRPVNKAIDDKTLRWLITGTEGEIEVTTTGTYWQMTPAGVVVRLRSGKDTTSEEVDIDGPDGTPSKVDFPGTNTAWTYEAFALGDQSKYATFESALATHRLLDDILGSSK